MTRAFQIPKEVCQLGTLCHVYATLPENTDSEVLINVHSGLDIKNLELYI